MSKFWQIAIPVAAGIGGAVAGWFGHEAYQKKSAKDKKDEQPAEEAKSEEKKDDKSEAKTEEKK